MAVACRMQGVHDNRSSGALRWLVLHAVYCGRPRRAGLRGVPEGHVLDILLERVGQGLAGATS